MYNDNDYDLLDTMERDSDFSIIATSNDFQLNIDFAFNTYSQSIIDTRGKGSYLLNH